MKQYLERLKIDGFRGINDPLILKFDEGLNIIYGPNGVGKSSVIQSVPWCLTGKIPYLSGGDFRKEDAIVNLFTTKRKASVTIFLRSDGKLIKITRTRPLRKTSSPGTQPLEVKIDDTVFSRKKAVNYLTNTLGINFDDIIRNIVLHQQTIRETLSTKPVEQSRAIDRLLGTLEIREFTEALDPKRQILNTKNELTERIEALERDRVQFTIKLREQLEQEKKNLILQGYDQSEIFLKAVARVSRSLILEVKKIMSSLSAPSFTFSIPTPTLDSILSCMSELETSLERLERFRVDALTEIQTRILKLQSLENKHNIILTQIEKIGDISIEALEAEKKNIEEELSKIKKKKNSLEQKLISLSSYRLSINEVNQQLKDIEKKISSTIGKYGEVEDYSRLISRFEAEKTTLEDKISKMSKRQRLTSLAITYLEDTQPKICPICYNEMTVIEVLNNLKTSIRKELDEEISRLRIKIKENEINIEEIKKATKEIQKLTKEKKKITSSLKDYYLKLGQILKGEVARARYHEIKEINDKLQKKINLIYLLGFEWEKGTGKSALIINSWKKLNLMSNIVNVYIKCSNFPPLNNPSGFCIGIVKEWHKENILWQSLKTLIKRYIDDIQPLFPKKASVETLFNAFPKMPLRLPLTRYIHVSDPEELAFKLADWLNEKMHLDRAICQKWLNAYLISPLTFEDIIDKSGRRDSINYYRFFVQILDLVGFKHLFIFLDQFEDALMKIDNPKVGEFCLGMRRILEAGIGFTTLILTLHPDGETKLSAMGGEYLTQLAPIDSNHMVSIMTLKEKLELVIPLSQAYLKKFRIIKPKYPTYPFTENALRFLCHVEGGNIRQILQRLHYCIEFGLEKNIDEITINVIVNNPRETIGREISPKEYKKFIQNS